MSQIFCARSSVVCMVVILFALSVATAAPTLQNGNFSSGLDSWTVESGTVTDGGGYAFFQEDPVSMMSSLVSQEFTLPAGATGLSFERIMNYGGGSPNTDFFAVSLFDSAFNPLLSYDSGVTWFYSIDTHGTELMVPSANVVGNIVTLDVTSFAGQNVLLAFDFFSEDDGVTTTVALDNVNVSVIPAPGALLLGFIGTGLVSLLRRAKKI